jgi:hypothetical protein
LFSQNLKFQPTGYEKTEETRPNQFSWFSQKPIGFQQFFNPCSPENSITIYKTEGVANCWWCCLQQNHQLVTLMDKRPVQKNSASDGNCIDFIDFFV